MLDYPGPGQTAPISQYQAARNGSAGRTTGASVTPKRKLQANETPIPSVTQAQMLTITSNARTWPGQEWRYAGFGNWQDRHSSSALAAVAAGANRQGQTDVGAKRPSIEGTADFRRAQRTLSRTSAVATPLTEEQAARLPAGRDWVIPQPGFALELLKKRRK